MIQVYALLDIILVFCNSGHVSSTTICIVLLVKPCVYDEFTKIRLSVIFNVYNFAITKQTNKYLTTLKEINLYRHIILIQYY